MTSGGCAEKFKGEIFDTNRFTRQFKGSIPPTCAGGRRHRCRLANRQDPTRRHRHRKEHRRCPSPLQGTNLVNLLGSATGLRHPAVQEKCNRRQRIREMYLHKEGTKKKAQNDAIVHSIRAVMHNIQQETKSGFRLKN